MSPYYGPTYKATPAGIPATVTWKQSSPTDWYTSTSYQITSSPNTITFDQATGTTTASWQQSQDKWFSYDQMRDGWIEQPPRRLQPPREFNRYINASDLMEEFIGYLNTVGVRQGEVMDLPVELFIKWLIIRACEEDQEEPNVSLELPARRTPQPRCAGCQRFLRRDTKLALCGPACATLAFERAA